MIDPSRSNPECPGSESRLPMVRHLYVHVPFCHHLCPYCGFYKHHPGKLANRRFVEALLAEVDQRQGEMHLLPKTIFFGGGTPTLLSPTHLAALLEGLRERLDLSQLEEWTVEANPATFDLEKARLMRAAGVTRVSLGVQSWDEDILRVLGRDHSAAEAASAFDTLREADFSSIGIDLMFSVPGQTVLQWKTDLQTAIGLGPEHLSTYNLTYEEDTEFLDRFERGELDQDEERDATLFELAIDLLEESGYRHYEISNFARPGHESIHNRAYWNGADFLGIGPSGVSTVQNRRWKSLADTAAWVERTLAGVSTKTEEEHLQADDLRLEALALQLRTAEGVAEATVRRTSDESLAERIDELISESLLVRSANGRLSLTRQGKALADPIAARLA